ncbi:receptor-like protein Cf-9 homolog [Hibiscus syriacus]|uniref:receptor-like protein Cf-9 homolog n=1 Tax=Hibiscus syriacus TaxID=106335 RepID=UPI001922E0A7|nr:receptor-like protein Cf-9 homolog [Hibiscus syriacus]
MVHGSDIEIVNGINWVVKVALVIIVVSLPLFLLHPLIYGSHARGLFLFNLKNTISHDDYRGDDYPKTVSWNKNIDCCSWEGINCDELTGHVIGIDLGHSCLTGSLFANNSLFHLRNLQYLDLSSNYLDGSPLENTSSLFHIQGLRRLNLAYNNFYGTVSSELFNRFFSEYLTTLTLNGQGFDMLARNVTKLKYLVLDGVDMSDVAVISCLNLTSSLQHLSLFHFQLHGEFPTQPFQFPNLKHIDLSWNEDLTGYLPKTNWSTALESLFLPYCGGIRGSMLQDKQDSQYVVGYCDSDYAGDLDKC